MLRILDSFGFTLVLAWPLLIWVFYCITIKDELSLREEWLNHTHPHSYRLSQAFAYLVVSVTLLAVIAAVSAAIIYWHTF